MYAALLLGQLALKSTHESPNETSKQQSLDVDSSYFNAVILHEGETIRASRLDTQNQPVGVVDPGVVEKMFNASLDAFEKQCKTFLKRM